MSAKVTKKSKLKGLEDISQEIHALQRAIAGLRNQVSGLDSKISLKEDHICSFSCIGNPTCPYIIPYPDSVFAQE